MLLSLETLIEKVADRKCGPHGPHERQLHLSSLQEIRLNIMSLETNMLSVIEPK